MAEKIQGIYNYCDRWCEQCQFSNRCDFNEIPYEVSDADEFFNNLSDNLDKASKILEEICKQKGISLLNSPPTHPKQNEELNVRLLNLLSDTDHYRTEAKKLLDSLDRTLIVNQFKTKLNSGDLRKGESQILVKNWNKHLDTIYFYAITIHEKLDQAIREQKIEASFSLDEEKQVSNGSAKVAILCTQKSKESWEYLMSNDVFDVDDCIPFLAALQKMDRQFLTLFPNAMAFIRPGFDE